MSLISKVERDEISDLAEAAGLARREIRGALLDGIDQSLIPDNLPTPGLQLSADLLWVADHERLGDNTVPLLIWLRNAARLTRKLVQGADFLKWVDNVSARTNGEPKLSTERSLSNELLLRVDEKSVVIPEIKEQILFDQSTIIPFVFLEAGAKAGRSVALLSVPVYEGGLSAKTPLGDDVIFNGTGWVLGARHIITNHHVINARQQGLSAASEADFLLQGANAVARFDFDSDLARGELVNALKVVAWSQSLDYAILETSVAHGRPPLARRSSPFVMANDHIPVNIIQHPDGKAKRIGIRNNLVTQVSGNNICYLTDTKFGSSGSPVFDDTWDVVALHRGSVVADGVKYFGVSTVYVNIGTQLASIEQDLRVKFPAVWSSLTSLTATT